MHGDDDVAVIVDEAREGAEQVDFVAEFLAEFARERGGGRFAGFDLTAGKLPFQREVLVRGCCATSTWPAASSMTAATTRRASWV